MARMSGGKKLQPNLRVAPFVLDPFGIKEIDAVVSTHDHNDHIDVNVAAAVIDPYFGQTAAQAVIMLGLLLGSYWSVSSNLTVEATQELTEGGGFAVVALLVIPQIQYMKNKKGYFKIAEDYDEYLKEMEKA